MLAIRLYLVMGEEPLRVATETALIWSRWTCCSKAVVGTGGSSKLADNTADRRGSHRAQQPSPEQRTKTQAGRSYSLLR